MIDQYKIDKYFIDLYFPEHKLGIEIDENGHTVRLKVKEQEREETIKNLGITLITINRDKEGFDIFDEISETQDFIYESGLKIGQELKENKMIEDLEKILKIIKLNSINNFKLTFLIYDI